MKSPKPIIEKTNLHPRNLHRSGYDFTELIRTSPQLAQYVIENPDHGKTIDFSNNNAVKALNKGLLMRYYGIGDWDIPPQSLCPPVPGRADYIHYVADLLAATNNGAIPTGAQVSGLDIGVGANCIYPILGNSIYGWSFVGSDISAKAIQNCVEIIEHNQQLQDVISLQLQPDPRNIFKGVITPEDRFSFSICNPPFHASADEAAKAINRKNQNLATQGKQNFGGENAELWCEGGEIGFITQMIYESARFPMQCLWYTTLVSKQANLKAISRILAKAGAAKSETISMAQGQKTSRFVAWTFLSDSQRANWKF